MPKNEKDLKDPDCTVTVRMPLSVRKRFRALWRRMGKTQGAVITELMNEHEGREN